MSADVCGAVAPSQGDNPASAIAEEVISTEIAPLGGSSYRETLPAPSRHSSQKTSTKEPGAAYVRYVSFSQGDLLFHSVEIVADDVTEDCYRMPRRCATCTKVWVIRRGVAREFNQWSVPGRSPTKALNFCHIHAAKVTRNVALSTGASALPRSTAQ
jgi:hypothetical protein